MPSAAQQPAAAGATPAEQQRAVLDQYCVTCHNDRLETGGLTLEGINLGDIAGNAELWEKVVQKLRAGAMPPQPRPRPDQPTYDGIRFWLEAELDRAAAANLNPGRTEALHRLSRTEYRNVIRDLLGLDVDVTDLLPADDTSYGFDNIAGVLGVSPTLMERYLVAARKISRLAIGSPVPSPVAETFRIASDLGQDAHIAGLPFGTRGGTLLDFNFPEDAEYVISIVPDGPLFIEAHQLEVTLDGERVELFSVGRALEPGERRGEYATEADAREVRLRVNAGPHQVGVTFLKKTAAEQERTRKLYLRPFTGEGSGGDSRFQPYVERVTITGPYESSGSRPAIDTPSRARLFICQPPPDDDVAATACATNILSTLARRAFRRPVADDDVQRLLTFYEQGAAAGGFDGGIELALRRLLVSPEFLFRIEEDPEGAAPGTPYALSDLELASRLSFFVWSSIPDDELLEVAIRGELQNPSVLEAQTRRLLDDPRAKALVTNFAGQWLSLRNAAAVQPDEDQFPDFGEDLRQGFRRETELLFESILRENRSVVELLSADYTFINERLARHYGIPNVRGSHFRRVSLDDPARAGLLGHGSILTVTSHANRTSPVVRGKWVLENILGNPPPPPPPNVPALEETTTGKQLTMREAMEQHRANPVCASCHRVMDPMGLALEPFDAIGRRRTPNQTKTPMDLTGVLPDGTTFEGPEGLRAALLAHPDRFVTTLTQKLVTYAIGRGVEYYDAPAVRAITRAAADDDYRLTTLILGVVKSTPFRMRSTQS
jgi:mono/diheme cytochrome c family protein|tara:strand:+ start:22 stop:2349 length:2328 start_codon:yes stop_codon:yes gene_type:complete